MRGPFRAFAAKRNSLQLLPVRVLLAILAFFALAGASAAADAPVPPCGAPPVPGYAAVDAPPSVLLISGNDLAAWQPPACLGWQAKDDGVLVALAGSFHSNGTIDELLKRFGAISSLKNLQYWSV